MPEMTFLSLREQYPRFRYLGYDANFRPGSPGALEIIYHFEIVGLSRFDPHWRIPCDAANPSEDAALQRLIAALGMAELVSYWKITCSPTVEICFRLNPEQISWWKRLYFHGLGEFFYRNEISADRETFMKIVCTGAALPDAPSQKPLSGMLIPIGGGKDSIVTMNLLQDRLSDATAYLINHRPSSVAAAQAVGIPIERICEASRSLDKRMLACNARGFLNGHTPFSAIVAFSAVLTAYLQGKREVILSNESSANEATVLAGELEVNHQYSKSYAFERDFSAYSSKYLRCGVRYFSLLRPLTEFQIARYFADLPEKYHEIFRSCNAGAKTDSWCGHCAKCLFVSVMLSPFLSFSRIAQIIGADMLNEEQNRTLLKELCGVLPNKPFECVGSRKEVNMSLCLAIQRAEQQKEPLPLLVREYADSPLYAQNAHRAKEFGQEWQNEHGLSEEYAELVKKACVSRYANKQ